VPEGTGGSVRSPPTVKRDIPDEWDPKEQDQIPEDPREDFG
jgi:hypothetical protein